MTRWGVRAPHRFAGGATMRSINRLRLPALVVAAMVAGAAAAQAQSASSAASSSSSGDGRASAKATSDGKTSTDDKGCRVIRQSDANRGQGATSSVTTNPDGSLSGSTSAGSSGASASAGGGRASSDCVVVKPDDEVDKPGRGR